MAEAVRELEIAAADLDKVGDRLVGRRRDWNVRAGLLRRRRGGRILLSTHDQRGGAAEEQSNADV